MRTKGTYTLTPLSTFSLLSDACGFFTEPSTVQVRPPPPHLPLLPLWSYLNTATLRCNQHYICRLIHNHCIQPVQDTANMSCTDLNIHNHMLYLCNYLSFLLWESKLNVSGISFIPFFLDNLVLCLRLFAFQKGHQGHVISKPWGSRSWDHESLRYQVPVDSVKYSTIPQGGF